VAAVMVEDVDKQMEEMEQLTQEVEQEVEVVLEHQMVEQAVQV
tara:strand:+ start:494 stop:622 length:129 start_codon:yes stop_codon:yes gene_type:complete